jgi:hypothetical protein
MGRYSNWNIDRLILPMPHESQLLLDHAYASLCGMHLAGGKRTEPAGAASGWLRHFDVRVGTPQGSGEADGWAQGRTLWISPELMHKWLTRHQAVRERRANPWVRLSGVAAAFMVELATVGLRGLALSGYDLPLLTTALDNAPMGLLIGRELAQPYAIEVLTPDEFYKSDALRVAWNQKQLFPQAWSVEWQSVLAKGWARHRMRMMDMEVLAALPVGAPDEDISIEDRARWLAFAETEPTLPDWKEHQSNPVAVIRACFLEALAPMLNCKQPLPPFLFEAKAYSFRSALAEEGNRQVGLARNKIFDTDHDIKPAVRFECVLAALDALERLGAEDQGYEEALIAGLANVGRNG